MLLIVNCVNDCSVRLIFQPPLACMQYIIASITVTLL